MPVVFIPALLRDLSGGEERVTVPGETVREVVAQLDARYPGMQERLLENGQLRPGINVAVDGTITRQKLRHKLNENSEVHFLPAMSGGTKLS